MQPAGWTMDKSTVEARSPRRPADGDPLSTNLPEVDPVAVETLHRPFAAFARDIETQTPLRAAITAATRRPEPACVPPLIEAARLDSTTDAKASATARRLVEALRAKPKRGGVEGLVQEYALSSQEGVALMCLAEALLRVPDSATRDALIRDKIGSGDWYAHLGHSPSLFVNAATWGLVVTGKLTGSVNETGLATALQRLIAKGGEPLIRRAVDMAMRMMGEQFVTGQTIGEALAHARKWEARGFRYSYDMLGEAALTMADADRYYREYETAIHAIGAAAAGRGVIDGPGISVKLSALHPRYSRAQRERVLPRIAAPPQKPRGAGPALRHRSQHRCRGSGSAGNLARPSRSPVLRARIRGLERHRLRGPGLWQAGARRDRFSDRPRAALGSPADGATGQGRLLGQRDQARPGRWSR